MQFQTVSTHLQGQLPPLNHAVDLTDGSALYWNHSVEGLFIVRVLGPTTFQFEALNPAHERATGLKNSKIAGRSPEEVLPEETARKVLRQYRRCVRAGRPMSYRELLHLPGGLKHWRTNLVPVRNEQGVIIRLLGSARDITEQVNALEAAIKSQETLQHTLDALSSGIALLDAAGVIQSVNGAWRAFGERSGAVSDNIGNSYLDVCSRAAAEGDCDAGFVHDQLVQVLAGRADEFHHRYKCQDRHFQMHAMAFAAHGERQVVIAHEDVTESVHSQQLIAEQSQQILRVQEEERRRIALDLHDSTSQHLASVQFGLSTLQRGDDPGSVLDQMLHSLQEAQREIRNLSYLLHPPNLSGDNFSSELRLFALGFAKRMSREIEVRLRGPIDKLSIDLQHTLYHVVQEAFSNVARHSNATAVQLSLDLVATGLRLRVRDNGTLSKRQREFTAGVGLMGMRARIEQAGGELNIKTSPKGVTIDAGFCIQV